jgi:hypothetical protein
MTAGVDRAIERDTCQKLISLGYGRSSKVRLYGQEVQLISDPFPHSDGGFAVEVVVKSESGSRTLKLPLPVLHVASHKQAKRTA